MYYKMKFIFFLFLLLAIMGCTEKCTGQPTSTRQGYKDWYIEEFRCGVFVPESYDSSKKYPLVIYLHGKGDTVTRDNQWYHLPAAMGDPCIVLSPKCPRSETGEWGNSWSAEIPPMIKRTFEMMDSIKKYYSINERRIYIYGISMGAIGTFGLVQKYPDLFAAGYAICGWADTSMAPQLSRIPFWLFHGEKDDVVPVEGSSRIYKAVLAYGGKQIHYTEFKAVKHDAWKYVDDKEVIAWMLAQRK